MLGKKANRQDTFFIPGTIRDFIPDDHILVKVGVIVGADVNAADVHDGKVLPGAIDRIRNRVGAIQTVTGDKAYARSVLYKALEELDIDPLILTQKIMRKNCSGLSLSKFKYGSMNHRIKCLSGKWMTYVGEHSKGYTFKSKRTDCARCPLRSRCLGSESKLKYRLVRFPEGYDALRRARRRYAKGWSDDEQRTYKRRKDRAEGIHGEAKECHGLRRAVRRGLKNMRIQSYLTCATINLKRLAKWFISGGDVGPGLNPGDIRLFLRILLRSNAMLRSKNWNRPEITNSMKIPARASNRGFSSGLCLNGNNHYSETTSL